MPHRLELAVKATLKEMPDMLKVDDTISSLINFYGSYNRRAHLRQQANKKELKLLEVKNFTIYLGSDGYFQIIRQLRL